MFFSRIGQEMVLHRDRSSISCNQDYCIGWQAITFFQPKLRPLAHARTHLSYRATGPPSTARTRLVPLTPTLRPVCETRVLGHGVMISPSVMMAENLAQDANWAALQNWAKGQGMTWNSWQVGEVDGTIVCVVCACASLLSCPVYASVCLCAYMSV